MKFLSHDQVDFAEYLRQTENQQRLRSSQAFLSDLPEFILDPKVTQGSLMCWPKTHQQFAYRAGEATLYAGFNGTGKTLLTGQVQLGLIQQGKRCASISLEMKPKRSLARQLRQFIGSNFREPRFGDHRQYIQSIVDRMKAFTGDKLWMYDQYGDSKAETIVGVILYCANELKCDHIFVDNLSKVVNGDDDYDGQKWFIGQMCHIAMECGIHIHIVHHLKKTGTVEAMPTFQDVKGSGTITDQVDNIMLIHRNMKKERDIKLGKPYDIEEYDTMLMVEKQRNANEEDKAMYALWYHPASTQFIDTLAGKVMTFDDGPKVDF